MKLSLKRTSRFVASVLIVLHLVAIVVAPASVPPSPTSITKLFHTFRPYLQFTYLNHGYHYFAPDPGASSLMEYTVLDPDNRRWGRLPDRNQHWPRLLYHRYFMLTEFFGSIDPNDEALRQAVAGAYALQIAKQEEVGDAWIAIDHVTHELSTREELLVGSKLTDPRKYRYVPLGRYRSTLDAASDGISERTPGLKDSLSNSIAPGLSSPTNDPQNIDSIAPAANSELEG